MSARRPRAVKRAARWRAFLQWSPLPIAIALMVVGHAWWGLGIMLGTSLFMGYAILSPTTRLFGKVVRNLKEADGRNEGVWITIDDGPDADTTPKLLEILEREGAVATFFVIGMRAEKNVELIRDIVRRGHQLGNHTQTHPASRFWSSGGRTMWAELSYCQSTLHNICGVVPTWFRAPVGHYNFQTHPVAKELGLRIASWSSRGFDAVRKDVSKILASIERDLKPGAVVLLHDVRPVSAEVLEGTLKLLKDRGLKTRLPEEVSNPQ